MCAYMRDLKGYYTSILVCKSHFDTSVQESFPLSSGLVYKNMYIENHARARANARGRACTHGHTRKFLFLFYYSDEWHHKWRNGIQVRIYPITMSVRDLLQIFEVTRHSNNATAEGGA